jgi:hypothetical protein
MRWAHKMMIRQNIHFNTGCSASLYLLCFTGEKPNEIKGGNLRLSEDVDDNNSFRSKGRSRSRAISKRVSDNEKLNP